VCQSTAAQLSFHFQNSGNSLLGLISFFFSLQYLVATGGHLFILGPSNSTIAKLIEATTGATGLINKLVLL
jgi:hypothetical protein